MTDATIAAVGRRLARALARAAYGRDPESKRAVSLLQTELCQAAREESAAESESQIAER
jgi:hypothetical protein